ncbi:MAG: ATP-binding cassette domain-containing protein [Labilithrix sp.]|nr:ATP-binding cassette domain-containing protein [Labilithrix sp.]
MHAAGHAFLAAAAGVLARALAWGPAPMDAGSTFVLPVSGFPDFAVLPLAIAGVFAAIVKLVGGALASWAEARVAGDVAARVRLTVLDDVLALNGLRRPRHDDHGSSVERGAGTPADRLAALTSHVGDVERGVAHGVLAEVRAVAQLVPLGVLLVVLAPELAGTAVLALGGFGVLAFSLRRAFKRAHARASRSATALVGAADEAVRHAELWATYGAKRRIRAHVARVGRAIAREAARIRVRASLLSSTSEVLGATALVLALALASRGALGVDHGTVVPFAIAFFMAYRPLRELVDARLARARGEEALAAALGEGRVGVEEAAGGERAAASDGATAATAWTLEPLVLTGVRARHGEHASISVSVPAGAIVALVGPTGIGKTSLLRALLGLEPLQAGEVRYGAQVLEASSGAEPSGTPAPAAAGERRGVGPSARPFAWVPQDAPIVGDTLAINVGLGRADDDAAVPDPVPVLAKLGNEALGVALGDDVLGTDRPLSGGERQWIAVARALATGLPVLLLDEPTSALDGASQARLLEAIARLRGERTVILVTHRTEPLAIADVVLRLEPLSDARGSPRSRRPAPRATSSRR